MDSESCGLTSAIEQKVSPIQSELKRNEKLIAELDGLLTDLGIKINPILSPELSKECSDSQKSEERAPLADMMKSNNNNLSWQMNRIKDLIGRIEL